MINALATAQSLIQLESVTTHSNAVVADHMRSLLLAQQFTVEKLDYTDLHGISKVALAAKRLPQSTSLATPDTAPGIAYFCHNDVVSVEGWNAPQGGPWDAVVADGKLWGRGACDMKGSAAAALAAIANIPIEEQTAPIYFFATGDEESGMAGAQWLVENSRYYRELVDNKTPGVIGEPTNMQLVNSHKGGCHLEISSLGVAAHSSTQEGLNANWAMIPFLTYLKSVSERCETDPTLQNSSFSPPTLSLNVVLKNEPAMSNITVGKATCHLFLRSMPDTQWRQLHEEIAARGCELGLTVKSMRPLLPLHTPAEHPFVQSVLQLLGQFEPAAVCYATDGCCFEELPDLVVLGPGSIEQAHRPDEWITLAQLELGTTIYEQLFRRFSCSVQS
ncbi:M20/M25/M40 family metallo-hydrolase [Aureliella helgolandensis]|uniref:Acetylornithine deacetylase n=1 Tax=Aureliella helgolandensis TaxID=2527968 RepID=A0A518G235_9BACT|nr:M20/M25/M40 family metallo-hydrolase [Aureliella helgolandensis]QDV22605.1 Acetylornithine deacetylase [Aureliella helgolandensis]